jgi:hypothetical protein
MHDNETKAKFIELRPKNWSYHRIADQLNISAGTAHTWAAEFSVEIQKLRAIEMEAIQERVLSSYEQDLTYLAEELKRVQQELRGRDYGYCDTQQLFWYQGALMARIDKKCAPIEIPAPAKADDAKLNKTERFCQRALFENISAVTESNDSRMYISRQPLSPLPRLGERGR